MKLSKKAKADRQRRYNLRYRSKLGILDCPCGRKATQFSRGEPVCSRCLQIEQRYIELKEVLGRHETGMPEYRLHLAIT